MMQQWDSEFIIHKDPSIGYLELYAVTAAVLAWGHKLANRRVTIFCDNDGCCKIINKMTARNKNDMVLVRILVLHQIRHNFRLYAKWLKSSDNAAADDLSRLKFKSYLKVVKYKTNKQATEVPEEIWPMNKIWID